MVLAASLVLLSAQAQAKPVTLGRVFKPGEKYTYEVKSHLQTESRQQGLETFIPEDLDINYTFTVEVLRLKADGIAVVRYKRPTITIIEGETFDSPPTTKVEKPNMDVEMTVSPVNEILDAKEIKPSKAPAKAAKWAGAGSAETRAQGAIANFVQDVYRLALFTGSFDSALDFSPKLSLTEVAPGETWKRTVSYQPQKLRGSGNKSAVQRLDYTLTYVGPVTVNGKSFQRVTAVLNLDTDLGQWANEESGDLFEEPHPDAIKKLPLKLAANIEYDLDPKSGHTVSARATCNGGFKVFVNRMPNAPLFEENLKGRTTMVLQAITPPPAPKK